MGYSRGSFCGSSASSLGCVLCKGSNASGSSGENNARPTSPTTLRKLFARGRGDAKNSRKVALRSEAALRFTKQSEILLLDVCLRRSSSKSSRYRNVFSAMIDDALETTRSMTAGSFRMLTDADIFRFFAAGFLAGAIGRPFGKNFFPTYGFRTLLNPPVLLLFWGSVAGAGRLEGWKVVDKTN